MNLDDSQKQKIREWIEAGLKLSEIQDKLNKEFGLSMTYMQLRFLIDDLGVKPKDQPKETPPANLAAAAAQPPKSGPPGKQPAGAPAAPEEPALGGGVSVTVDQITRPGALVSGKVTFSDGETGVWMLDQTGRPGLDPDTQGYRPTPEDIQEFQIQLRDLIQKSGL